MRAFTSNTRRAAPCCDTRPASGCQGLFFLSQSFINIRVNKQRKIPIDFKTPLIIKFNYNKILPITFALLCTIETKERYQLSCVQLFAASWTVALPAPLSMGFPRQEYWSGLPFPSPGDLPDPGIEPMALVSPALARAFFATVSPGKPQKWHMVR